MSIKSKLNALRLKYPTYVSMKTYIESIINK